MKLRFSNDWNFARSLFPMIGTFCLLVCGCATKQPGGRADVWTTSSYAEENIIYNAVGVRF